MTNAKGINAEIKIGEVKLETVKSFKYLGAIVTDQGSKPEVIARIRTDNSCSDEAEDHLE